MFLELGYIEVFENAIMFVRINCSKPVDDNYYVTSITYSVEGDFDRLKEKIPETYKRFIASEEDL